MLFRSAYKFPGQVATTEIYTSLHTLSLHDALPISFAAGLTSVPADRRTLGLIPDFSLRENLTLPSIGESWRGGFIHRGVEENDAEKWLQVTGVTPPDPKRLVEELSGGNQQKAMLAKALRLKPEVLVLAEPTQAVDVGAAASIRRLITELAEQGQCVLVSTALKRDRKSTRLNSSHVTTSRMPSSA